MTTDLQPATYQDAIAGGWRIHGIHWDSDPLDSYIESLNNRRYQAVKLRFGSRDIQLGESQYSLWIREDLERVAEDRADEPFTDMELWALLEAALSFVRKHPGTQHDYRLDAAIQKFQSFLDGTADIPIPIWGSEIRALIAADREILEETPRNEPLVFAVAKLEHLVQCNRAEELAKA